MAQNCLPMFKRYIWAFGCLGACHDRARPESYLNISLQLYLIAPGKNVSLFIIYEGKLFSSYRRAAAKAARFLFLKGSNKDV